MFVSDDPHELEDRLEYIIHHVFCPPKLPEKYDDSIEGDQDLCGSVLQAAVEFQNLYRSDKWKYIIDMLRHLHESISFQKLSTKKIIAQVEGLHYGGFLVYFIRAQNAGVVLRRSDHDVTFESFEVSPTAAAVIGTAGKLLCSYPGTAISVPSSIVYDMRFLAELASFLSQMDENILDSAPTTTKAGSTVREERDTTHPRYITEFLTGILRGIGRKADVLRIQKRIRDEVLWSNTKLPWRRSPLWLVIRVALQTTLTRETDGLGQYKSFMVLFMQRILMSGLESDLQSDVLYYMRAKVCRRLYKLGSTAPPFLQDMVNRTAEQVQTLLQKRWDLVQDAQAKSPDWQPKKFKVDEDTRLSLNNSRQYLTNALLDQSPREPSSWEPQSPSRYRSIDAYLSAGGSSLLGQATGRDAYVALADFELAVEGDIDDWVADVIPSNRSSACMAISDCMARYSELARKLYAENPEDLSIMILTLLELWVALDKIAVDEHEMLAEYSPEIPISLSESLILRKAGSLGRLQLIQEHLRSRHQNCHTGWTVFTNQANRDTFSIRFFESSEKHILLKEKIEKDATKERNLTLAQLDRQNTLHSSLYARAMRLQHTHYINNLGREYHSRACEKCSLENHYQNLRIDVHEWPLPEDISCAKAVVFELDCPATFAAWRSATFHLLVDVCTPPEDRPSAVSPHTILPSYLALSTYMTHDFYQRITLASITKPFTIAHYRDVKIPSSIREVCVNNGLSFKIYDKLGHKWAANSFSHCTRISRFCTFVLPSGPYANLQYAVNGTRHTHNDIIAGQSTCHQDLNIHEYMAFGALRSGPLLQWLNVLRELRAQTFSFRQVEVGILIMQTVWQVGPLSAHSRWTWHEELENSEFGHALLGELQILKSSIEDNWLEGASMRIITILACRLLSSALDEDVKQKIYCLLREVRCTTFQWVNQLSIKLEEAGDGDTQSKDFQSRVRDMAATCRATYDVDPHHLPFLLSRPNDVAAFIQCAVIIYNNLPPDLDQLPSYSKILVERERRLSHSLENEISRRIQEDRTGFDTAILSIWHGYRPGSPWQNLEYPNENWLSSSTSNADNQQSQCLHYNVLEGRLLIDGKPLGHLPLSYIQHPTYRLVFGQRVSSVIPADMPGMDFAMRSSFYGHQVYFAMTDDEVLVIRTKTVTQSSAQVSELIPSQNFSGDLPELLVGGHVHWLNIGTREIEIRPSNNAWQMIPSNWRIYFSLDEKSSMRRPLGTSIATFETLVDVRSPTCKVVSARLEALEYPKYHLITSRTVGPFGSDTLFAELPRLGLSFFVDNDGHLQCQNLRGMIVDTNQSAGTLIGIRNQLLLIPSDPQAKLLPRTRCIIIPHGKLSCASHGHHITVDINTKQHSRVQYHIYKIDTELGCLVGNVSLTNKLYKAYLHAVSSHCLPDSLTGHTGTEEALHDLSSASLQSFQALSSSDVELLHQIASLTPSRTYYPEHLKCMEKVGWSLSLAPTAQHHGLLTCANSILNYATCLQIFHDNARQPLRKPTFNAHLLERAAIRNALLYPEEYARPLPPDSRDVEYKARHTCDHKEASVFRFSEMIYQWPPKVTTSSQVKLMELFQGWGKELSGAQSEDALRSLGYTCDWFQLDLPKVWLSIFDLCRSSSGMDCRYPLLFSLPAIAYGSLESQHLIPVLLAFAVVPQFGRLDPPTYMSYNLSSGFEPQKQILLTTIRSHDSPFHSSSEAYLEARKNEDEQSLQRRRYSTYQKQQDLAASGLVDYFFEQWPCEELSRPTLRQFSLRFDLDEILVKSTELFRSWYRNARLRDHIMRVQSVLDSHLLDAEVQDSQPYRFAKQAHKPPSESAVISFAGLFSNNAPDLNRPPKPLRHLDSMASLGHLINTKRLRVLLSEFKRNNDIFHRLYGNSLDDSRIALEQSVSDTFAPLIPFSFAMLEFHRQQCGDHYRNTLNTIQKALSPAGIYDKTMFHAGQWPRITARSLLEKLRPASTPLPIEWKRVIISLANALLLFQRSQRLIALAMNEKHEDFFKELENTNGDGWDTMEHTDWLLIQIESHFLVRRVQADIALEMICPTSSKNTTLQLLMGEGKSSVIVPIVAATLADGNKLVRVVVLKPLAVQMFQSLVERLSGLTNRRIFYLPFSRSVKLDTNNAAIIRGMYKECLRVGGIWVAQPDHILSYKLMSIEQQLLPDSVLADALLDSQKWLDMHTRDILDESDEILHVRYQLLYTVGFQNHLEGSPERWTTMQQLFWLVKKNVHKVADEYPLGIQIQQSSPASFPSISILQSVAGTALISLITKRVLQGELPNYNFTQIPAAIRPSVATFVEDVNLSAETTDEIRQYAQGSGLWQGLLHLRGLLAHGILLYALKDKRWRVNYGLDLNRSLLAVPYRAKDVPAHRAEFGHPDVAVALTCLSYYYGGLSESQLDVCFELLYKSDNPALEYETWINGYDDQLPESLRQLAGVNPKSVEQRQTYFSPLFRCSQAVIDFYLARVVFPKQAKEFPHKLLTSGWDIAERKDHVTTGFSGTNDNRYLLPTSISQNGLPQQLLTNAKVLNYLLQDENDHYTCTSGTEGARASTEDFLNLLVAQNPEIRVLLDVGAQMLELRNKELVALWLFLKKDAQAAIFFGDNDEMQVLDRKGNVESFISSPFNQQIDQCLLYLDDAHTRGTDVKLPQGSRAGVTLGPRVTKDRLTQGCMRMRRLGNGHSVMFFAPLEVDQSIRKAAKLAGKSTDESIHVTDVLRWVMFESCSDIQQRVSQWAEQGLDHQTRAKSWAEFSSGNTEGNTDELASSWRQRESRTLEEMYGLKSSGTHPALQVPELRERCEQLGMSMPSEARMDEEQEREVAQEVEREQQIERPPKIEAAEHEMHRDVQYFIRTGRIAVGSSAFKHAFSSLRHTAAEFTEHDVWSPNLLVTEDFTKTVKLRSYSQANDFVRPCNWIISSQRRDSLVLVITSPYEINMLLPEIRKSNKVRLHLYTPRVTKAMRPTDDLTLYMIPPTSTPFLLPVPSKIQLNILAGQLYLSNYDMYLNLCRFLGIYTSDLGDNVETDFDGFIDPSHRPQAVASVSRFRESPIPSLKALIGLRRKGLGYRSTHLGKILQARALTDEDFSSGKSLNL
ncbi:hypothetical protein SERLA73DRAFT_70404 [Serpula lacrymans var. lacrymans S7.3]|uniref:ubiquitinyl hydrolase 1 n=2 Tax=Serpula lacrymans var. lacrymans TaxID=341189 RepID=F8PMT2_SERL3|nr:uncharacterized protein SERLADRAFT_434526 [Serpula lacrymans var. lacrymans S7.9]EGO02914.1 hypothetical protein SERLA73DRAFT_70404 [Serpula lacrymans var. lacrymans S7.3]EGO28603.1 hypothetical protein SERLADRAFT_434526 [Serpula lacrymans var. lacrymans S7.9]